MFGEELGASKTKQHKTSQGLGMPAARRRRWSSSSSKGAGEVMAGTEGSVRRRFTDERVLVVVAGDGGGAEDRRSRRLGARRSPAEATGPPELVAPQLRAEQHLQKGAGRGEGRAKTRWWRKEL